MALVNITTWSGFKYESDKRKLGVYAEWDLTNQKVQLKQATNGELAKEAVFTYEITSEQGLVGKFRTDDFIFVKDTGALPPEHKIIIESFDVSNGNAKEDDDSMYSKDAPVL